MNEAAAEIIGRANGPMVGVRIGSQGNPWLAETAERAIRTGRPQAYLQEYDSPVTGDRKRLIVTYLPDTDRPPAEQRLFIQAIDVTGMVDQESGGGIERAQFEALVRQLLGGIIVLAAPDGAVLFANARAREILDIEVGEVPSPLTHTHDEAGHVIPELPVVRALTGEVVRGEEVVICADAVRSTRVVVSAAPLLDKSGQTVAALGLLIDITPRRQHEEDLETSKTAFESRAAEEGDVRARVAAGVAEDRALISGILEKAQVGLVLVDTDGLCARTNKVFDKLLGYDRNEIEGKRYDQLIFIEDLGIERRSYADLAAGRSAGYAIEQRFVRRDGELVWAKVNATLVPAEGDGRLEVIRLVQDLTGEVRVREQVAEGERAVRKAYADVISAVTGDRLVLITPEELPDHLGRLVLGPWGCDTPEELSGLRHEIADGIARSLPGMRDPDGFVLACAEAMANALKHAGGGRIELRRAGEKDQAVICDHGPGIGFGTLPKATLLPGYSTMASSLGMGFTMMLETCDDVLLTTGHHGTTVVLEMRERSAVETAVSRV
jgi:PAS domain S-box-containing protein